MKFISECLWLCSHKLICICLKSSKNYMASVLYVQQITKRVFTLFPVCTNRCYTLYLFHNRNNISRRENLHGNRQPNNWDLNDVVYLPPPPWMCAAWYTALLIIFSTSIINHTETLIMIITKKDQSCTISFLQYCNKIAWLNPMNEIKSILFLYIF